MEMGYSLSASDCLKGGYKQEAQASSHTEMEFSGNPLINQSTAVSPFYMFILAHEETRVCFEYVCCFEVSYI